MSDEVKRAEPRHLTMKFAGRFIDLLGQQMYGGPVPAVAELIANAWDADAPSVEVFVPEDPTAEGAEIIVKDAGVGMTFDELNEFYLSIGYERRRRGERTVKNRLVMGRKGIGKLAGFGIAEDIVVRSIKNKHVVQLTLNYQTLRAKDTLEGLRITPDVDEPTSDASGVQVTFRRLKLTRRINLSEFRNSMSRRFALQTDAMQITINGEPLTKQDLDFEFREPALKGAWQDELLDGNRPIKFWFGFLKETVKDPELAGASVLARGRLAQATPFFFNLSGGIEGQIGLDYVTGQVQADFLDESEDCIATDRQSVNWQFDIAKALEQWGQQKLKRLCADWKKRRTQRSLESFRHDYSALIDRIQGLPDQEQADVTAALDRIAELETLEPKDFHVIASSLLEGVERESVKKVIRRINAANEGALEELILAVKEWDIISAVSTAEVVIGRVEIIKKFERYIEARVPEKAGSGTDDMQTFVKDHPWLLGPSYESLQPADFHHEHGVDKWIEDVLLDADKEAATDAEKKSGRRFDLLCIKNEWQVVILELMRPGEPADYDHLMRLNFYVTKVEAAINDRGTAHNFRGKAVNGLLIADKRDTVINRTLAKFQPQIDAITWKGLFETVFGRYSEFFDLLKEKAPDDPRMKGFVKLRTK